MYPTWESGRQASILWQPKPALRSRLRTGTGRVISLTMVQKAVVFGTDPKELNKLLEEGWEVREVHSCAAGQFPTFLVVIDKPGRSMLPERTEG